MEGLPLVGSSLFSSFRDPDQFCNRPPQNLFRIFWNFSVRLKIFSEYSWNFPSTPKSFQDIFGTFPSAPKIFQDIFGTFSSALEIFSGYFGQYDFLIQLSHTNFHLLEFVCGHKSSSALVIRPLDSNCGFCLSCAVFEQLSQLLS